MLDTAVQDPEALARLIGRPDAPEIWDVCLDEDFREAPFVIPGARRVPHHEVDALAPELAGRQVVIICQKGLKLSQGAAALLRAQGIAARYLEGGMVDWARLALPRRLAEEVTPERWVLDAEAGQDAWCAAWIVTRMIRRDATLLWVTADQVAAVADRFDAIPARLTDGPVGALIASWARMRDVTQMISNPDIVRLAAGTRALHGTPEDQFRAMACVYDMVFAASQEQEGDRA